MAQIETLFVEGDTAPHLTGTVTSGGVAVNLAGATVVLRMQRPDKTMLLRSATVTDAATGAWAYAWQAGELTAGLWWVDVETTWSDASLQTSPSDLSIAFKVRARRSGAAGSVVVPPMLNLDLSNLTGMDAAVAAKVSDPASVTSSALLSTYARPVGAGVARFITRARAGVSLKIVGVGDSVMAGGGATLGTNDFLTLISSELGARFPAAAITQSNRGLSGSTVATIVINGYFANGITDAGDLYILMFGKNDTVADAYGVPVQGYPLAQAKRGLEVMVREIRRRVPQADIIIAAENPNAAADATGNANLSAFNTAARDIAAAYGCEFVDCFTAFTALGNYSTYLMDAVHPSLAGHRLIADTLLASIPSAAVLPIGGGALGPDGGITAVADIKADAGYNGWVVRQAIGSAQSGVWVNAGTWSGSNPYQTTTANDYAEFTFVGTEFALRTSTAAGDALVVDVAVDGATTQTNLNMSTVPSAFQPFVLLAKGMAAGFQHKVRVTLKSGTLKVYQAAWLASNLAQANPTPRRLKDGRWLGSSGYIPATTNPGAGAATVTPFYVPRTRTMTDIACDITTLAAGSTVELGVYGSDEFDQPLGLIFSAGTVDSSTTGFKSLSLAMDDRVLTPGWYWLATLPLGGAPVLRGNNGAAADLVSTSANTTAAALNGYRDTGLSALPAKWTATLAVGVAPRVVVKFN